MITTSDIQDYFDVLLQAWDICSARIYNLNLYLGGVHITAELLLGSAVVLAILHCIYGDGITDDDLVNFSYNDYEDY